MTMNHMRMRTLSKKQKKEECRWYHPIKKENKKSKTWSEYSNIDSDDSNEAGKSKVHWCQNGDKFYGNDEEFKSFSKSKMKDGKVKTKSLVSEPPKKEINPLRYLLSEVDGKCICYIYDYKTGNKILYIRYVLVHFKFFLFLRDFWK